MINYTVLKIKSNVYQFPSKIHATYVLHLLLIKMKPKISLPIFGFSIMFFQNELLKCMQAFILLLNLIRYCIANFDMFVEFLFLNEFTQIFTAFQWQLENFPT